jgi:hypothetical protein
MLSPALFAVRGATVCGKPMLHGSNRAHKKGYIRSFTYRPKPQISSIPPPYPLGATHIFWSQNRHAPKGVTSKAPPRSWSSAILLHSLETTREDLSRLSQFISRHVNIYANSMRWRPIRTPLRALCQAPNACPICIRARMVIAAGRARGIFFELPGSPREFRNGRYSSSSKMRMVELCLVIPSP